MAERTVETVSVALENEDRADARAALLAERSSLLLAVNRNKDALADGEASVQLAMASGEGHHQLGRAQLATQNYGAAVASFKTALNLGFDSPSLQRDLQRARIGVLENLTDDAAPPPEPATSAVATVSDAPPPLALPVLDTSSTARYLVWRLFVHSSSHLAQTSRQLQIGTFLLLAGISAWLMHNWRIVCLGLALGAGAYYVLPSDCRLVSVRRLNLLVWARLPWVVYSIPLILRVVGQVKLFAIVHETTVVAIGVTVATALAPSPRARMCIIHFALFLYVVCWCQDSRHFFKMLASLALDSAGYALSCIDTADVRRAMLSAIQNVATETDIAALQRTARDTFGLLQWLVDYWQQPTTFSYSDVLSSVAACHEATLRWFHPQLQRHNPSAPPGDLAALAAYLEQLQSALQPPKSVAVACASKYQGPLVDFFVVTVAQDGSSLLAACALFVGGTVPIALVPFVWAQAGAMAERWRLWQACGADCDSLDWIFLPSPLHRVWTNLKAAVYCLKVSARASRAVATASAAALLAKKTRNLVAAIAVARSDGGQWDGVTEALFALYASRRSAADVWAYVWHRA
ncbi:hypothetical protein ACHHYP_12089 [Achlya hypogyna]|uniref:Transmembrane protein n=1 Tax=Achlya hypogyna TaxID=1202772 RepID=A0A1V9YHM1_ACHHY|nr:hypothetical protein ACHHYP_12089 [Achlya hypogyna]